MKKLFGAAFVTAGLLAFAPAQAQDVTNAGLVNDPSDLAGAFRARDFAGSNGEGNVYVGTPDLGVGANRTEDNFDPGGPAWGATNTVTFTYDDTGDTLTVDVDVVGVGGAVDHSVVFNNLSGALGGKDVDLNNLNILQILVLDREASATTDFNNVVLTPDGDPPINLGDFPGGGSFGTGTWSVTDVDLSDGFTLTGDIVLSGGPFTSNEKNKVEVQFGTTDLVIFDEQTVFLNTTGGQILSIPDSETVFPGTNCGGEPSGIDGSVNAEINIPFDSNNLKVTQDLTAPGNGATGLCIFDDGAVRNPSNTDPNVMIANTIVGNGEDDYLIELDEGVAAIGFRFLTNFEAVESITLYDDLGIEITTINIDALTDPNTRQFVGFFSPSIPIQKILIDTDEGHIQNEGIDEIKVAEFGISKQITSGPCIDAPEEFCDVTADEFVKIPDGIDNGGFDAPVGCTSPFDGPLASLDDWSVDNGNVDLICSLWEDQDGGQSLDLSGLVRGTISQSIDGLTTGKTYKVGFWMSGNPTDACGTDPSDELKELRVTIDTAVPTVEEFQFDAGDITDQTNDMMWRMEMVTFEAEAASHSLEFQDISGGSDTRCGVALDSVMLFEENPLFGDIALAVEAPQGSSLHYDFKITVIPPPDAVGDLSVHDTVPAEWDVSMVDGIEVGVDGDDGNPDTSMVDPDVGADPPSHSRLECGESQEINLGDNGNVEIERGGKAKEPRGPAATARGDACQSDTDLWWDLGSNEGISMLRVDLQSRMKNVRQPFFSPTGCGALFLNEGAKLFDDLGEIDDTGPLIVAAVEDLDGGGIDPTGQGDEDGDNLTDLEEVRATPATDPCEPDTDFDGVDDDVDECPLQGPPGEGEILVDGCIVPE